MLSRCFLDFSVGVGAFVIGLNQISAFFYSETSTEQQRLDCVNQFFPQGQYRAQFSLIYVF